VSRKALSAPFRDVGTTKGARRQDASLSCSFAAQPDASTSHELELSQSGSYEASALASARFARLLLSVEKAGRPAGKRAHSYCLYKQSLHDVKMHMRTCTLSLLSMFCAIAITLQAGGAAHVSPSPFTSLHCLHADRNLSAMCTLIVATASRGPQIRNHMRQPDRRLRPP
jgi:hypothetical protein